jgi:Autotransporter beta-domain
MPATMQTVRFFLVGLLLPTLFAVLPAPLDRAQAQATCSCPAGFPNYNPGTNTCNSGYPTFATRLLACRSNFSSIGLTAAGLQQNSFSAVAGELQTIRNGAQGNNPSSTRSGISGYSPANFDETFDLLGYSSNAQPKNPLTYLKAPPAAPAVDTGPKWAVWSEGFGDWERRSPLNADDIGRRQTIGGAHLGFDGVWQNTLTSGDFVVGGLLGSWMKATVNFAGLPASFTLEGPGVGLYSMYILGRFSADLTAKVDFLRLAEDFGGFLPDASADVTNAGLAGNLQYKNKFGPTAYVEPTVGFSMTRTMFGDNAALLGLKDASVVRVQGGARLGNTFDVNGITVEPILGLLLYSNVVAEGTSIATTPIALPIAPTDQGLLRGEVDPELNVDFNNGYSAYLRGVFRFGSEMFGANAKLGIRKQF